MAPVVEHHYFCGIPKTPLREPVSHNLRTTRRAKAARAQPFAANFRMDPLQAAFLAQFLTPRMAVTLFLDPDQCIYTYAGASPERTLVLLTQGLPQHVIELCTNYRSSLSLVEASLRLVHKNGTNRTMLAVRFGVHRSPRRADCRDQRGSDPRIRSPDIYRVCPARSISTRSAQGC